MTYVIVSMDGKLVIIRVLIMLHLMNTGSFCILELDMATVCVTCCAWEEQNTMDQDKE